MKKFLLRTLGERNLNMVDMFGIVTIGQLAGEGHWWWAAIGLVITIVASNYIGNAHLRLEQERA